MSEDSVRAHLAEVAPELQLLISDAPTATVVQAAAAFGVPTGQIAKTLALWRGPDPIVVVMGGDARLNNRAYKQAFGVKPRMMSPDDTLDQTGHAIGGVCPFALPAALPIYLDRSLRDFDEVLPAAGSSRSAVRISNDRLTEITGGVWVNLSSEPAVS